jgi:putative two-component system response regulator
VGLLRAQNERILIVADEPVRGRLVACLAAERYDCRTARDAFEALRLAARMPRPSLVLVDLDLPGLSGLELLRDLHGLDQHGLDQGLQIVMISALDSLGLARRCLREGAYDSILKPIETEDLLNTVKRAIERARLLRQNEEYRRDLERMVHEQTMEIRQTRDIALLTLAKLAESRDNATGQHLERMAAYSRHLAEHLARGPYSGQIAEDFVDDLFKSSPLHDIGKVGIPDAILRKPGPLDEGERAVMRTHPKIGGDTLRKVIEKFRGNSFLTMGMEIAYHHHERWGGGGYPHGLAGERIPLAARIVAVADAYDAITSERPYKASYEHSEAVRLIAVDRGRHFDPVVVDAFLACEGELTGIRSRFLDRSTAPSVRAPGGWAELVTPL